MRSLSVLLCPEYFLPAVGGGEVWAWQVARGLVQLGWRVRVLTYRTPEARVSERRDGVEVLRMGPYPIRGVQSYLTRALVQGPGIVWNGTQLDFDVLLCSNTFPLLPGRAIASIKHRPIVAMFHDVYGTGFSLQEKGLLRGLIRSVTERIAIELSYDQVIVNSEYVRSHLVAMGIPPRKISVVGVGAHLEEIDEVIAQRAASPTVLFVGRLVRIKRLDRLFRAFVIVRRDLPDARLIIGGTGPMESEYRVMVKTLGLDDAVAFVGWLDRVEMIQWIKRAHLVVLPSAREGFGVVVVESLAARTPVIVSDDWGPRELVVDGETGYLVEVKDADALASKMIQLLSNRDLVERLGFEGRRRVARGFTWMTVTERVHRVLLKAIEESNPSNPRYLRINA